MLKNILLLCLFIPGIVLAEYRNTNGTALEKSFSDMLKWIRSDQEPIRQAIAISSDWKELNLLKDDNMQFG